MFGANGGLERAFAAGDTDVRWASRGWIRFALIALATGALSGTLVCATIATFDVSDHGVRADAAVVLGAALYRGTPSPVLAARIDHGVRLLTSGRVQWLILTGGAGTGQSTSEAAASARYARTHGAPPSRLLLETRSHSTPQNLCFAQAVGTQHGVRTYLVVSDPLHLKRAMTIAARIGMSATPSATPTTRYMSVSSKLPFLLREAFFLVRYTLSRATGC